jgi:hypothetical protein
MTEATTELEIALERVYASAKAHLQAVVAADGRVDDESVWQAYVELSNASYDYDGLLLDQYDEVTPWNVPNPAEADRQFGVAAAGGDDEHDDPYGPVVSVRQRRDYRVTSVAALLKVAEAARSASPEADLDEDEPIGPIDSVSEAVLELLQAGDGSLGALDVPELEPLDGIVAVVETREPLDIEEFEETDAVGPFQVAAGDKLVGRLDEHPYARLDALVDGEDED